jgi:hypothetical protein
VDTAGNRSRPARVRLPPLPSPSPERRRSFPQRLTPIPEQQATDLARFTRFAESDDARDAFALLTAVEPSPGDARYDTHFQSSILARDHVVTLLATVPGAQGRTSLVVPVRIRAGLAAPILSAEELRLLIAAFPLQNESVTAVTLDAAPDRTVEIRVHESRQLRRFVWTPGEDPIGWAAEHGALLSCANRSRRAPASTVDLARTLWSSHR